MKRRRSSTGRAGRARGRSRFDGAGVVPDGAGVGGPGAGAPGGAGDGGPGAGEAGAGGAHRSGAVAVIGRPSAGKSTLINRMCGHDLAIVAPSPQTTRSRVRGIATRPGGQLLLIDTPGFQDSPRPFDARLQALTAATLREVDVVLAVIDPSRAGGAEEDAITALAAGFDGAVVVALGKADRPAAAGREGAAAVPPALAARPAHRVSGVRGDGVEELVERLIALSPPGPPMYADDRYTDQPQALRIGEVIRSHAIRATRQELPQAIYVEVADLESGPRGVWVRAFVNVERDSQKGIVIGERGRRIAAIRNGAQDELSAVLGLPVRLDLRVKVQRNWRRDHALLRRLIR